MEDVMVARFYILKDEMGAAIGVMKTHSLPGEDITERLASYPDDVEETTEEDYNIRVAGFLPPLP